jgi:hypothetical protein
VEKTTRTAAWLNLRSVDFADNASTHRDVLMLLEAVGQLPHSN